MTNFTQKNILGIDTSSVHLRLAVNFGGDRLVKSNEEIERSHGQFIVKKIRELLQSSGLETSQLDAIVVCTGPGSFTGLRIGLATAKGMAVALDIPVVGISLFEVAALRLAEVGRPVVVLAPARKGEYFAVEVVDGRCDLDKVVPVEVPQLSEFIANRPVAAFGPDRETDLAAVSAPDLSDSLSYDAAELVHLGTDRLNTDGPPDLAGLEPLYIRKSQAEIRFAQRRQDK